MKNYKCYIIIYIAQTIGPSNPTGSVLITVQMHEIILHASVLKLRTFLI